MSWNKFELATVVFQLLEKDLAVAGFELLDVRVFRGGGRVQIRVFVDTDEGIMLDQCTQAARTVGMLMEEADPIKEHYVIEVSSPGIRRPLRTPGHFQAQINQRVELKVSGEMKPRRIRGTLAEVGQGWLLVQPPEDDSAEAAQPIKIGMKDILEANLDPDFDVQALINADRRRRKDEKRRDRQEKRQTRKTGRRKATDGNAADKGDIDETADE